MINALAILFCLTLIYLAVTTRLSAYVLILVLQGVLVAGVHMLAFFHDFAWSHVAVAAGVLLVRTFLIPTYIVKIMRDLDMRHGDNTRRYHPGFLIQMAAVIVGAFVLSHQLSRLTPVNVVPLGAAIAGMAAGGLLIVRRRLLLAHVVGFLIIENGLFLLGLGVRAEMPWTIELAGFLDLFVLIFMGIAMNHLKTHFPEGGSDELTGLRD
jgi:Hydrogenase 4 membrane component (E)